MIVQRHSKQNMSTPSLCTFKVLLKQNILFGTTAVKPWYEAMKNVLSFDKTVVKSLSLAERGSTEEYATELKCFSKERIRLLR